MAAGHPQVGAGASAHFSSSPAGLGSCWGAAGFKSVEDSHAKLLGGQQAGVAWNHSSGITMCIFISFFVQLFTLSIREGPRNRVGGMQPPLNSHVPSVQP